MNGRGEAPSKHSAIAVQNPSRGVKSMRVILSITITAALIGCGSSGGSSPGGDAEADASLASGDAASSVPVTGDASPDAPSAVDGGTPCNPAGERFQIAADTVFDNRRCLTWQRAVDTSKHALADGVSYCAGLTLHGGGWRLATIEELTSLVVPGSPSIDGSAFPGTPAAWFMSSSVFVPPAGAGGAWVHSIAFYDGHAAITQQSDPEFVRCIR
jgi:hypothetical protein